MVLPIVLPRTEHTLSRRDVDPDALKVLYRLQQLEKRVSRIEMFILSGLCMIAASFMAGLFALLNLPSA